MNQFAPYSNITRQEMCVMIYRALKAAGKDMTPPPSGSFPFTGGHKLEAVRLALCGDLAGIAA